MAEVTENNTGRVPISPELVKLSDSKSVNGHLRGGRCSDCAEKFYPFRPYCPKCTSNNIEEIALGEKGIIESFTISRVEMPGSLIKAPYGLGSVRMGEGMLIVSTFAEEDPVKLKIGAPVKVVFEELHKDQSGNSVITFKFKMT